MNKRLILTVALAVIVSGLVILGLSYFRPDQAPEPGLTNAPAPAKTPERTASVVPDSQTPGTAKTAPASKPASASREKIELEFHFTGYIILSDTKRAFIFDALTNKEYTCKTGDILISEKHGLWKLADITDKKAVLRRHPAKDNWSDEYTLNLNPRRLSGQSGQSAGPNQAINLASLMEGVGKQQYTVADLKALLAHSDLNIRLVAAQTLTAMGDKAGIAGLLALINDPANNEDIRASAVCELGNQQVKETVPDLIKLLYDKSSAVRWSAVLSLGMLEAREAGPEVMKLLADPDGDARTAAVISLGIMGYQDALPELAKLLNGADTDAWPLAIESIGNIAKHSSIANLMKLLNDPNDTARKFASESLEKLGIKDTVPKLIKFLDDENPNLRYSAVTALGQIGVSEAGPKITRILNDPDSNTRVAAIRAITAINYQTAGPDITKLLGDTDNQVRQAAADVLGSLGATDAIPGLTGCLADPDQITRGLAAISLLELGAVDQVPDKLAEDISIFLNWEGGYDLRAQSALNKLALKTR